MKRYGRNDLYRKERLHLRRLQQHPFKQPFKNQTPPGAFELWKGNTVEVGSTITLEKILAAMLKVKACSVELQDRNIRSFAEVSLLAPAPIYFEEASDASDAFEYSMRAHYWSGLQPVLLSPSIKSIKVETE